MTRSAEDPSLCHIGRSGPLCGQPAPERPADLARSQSPSGSAASAIAWGLSDQLIQADLASYPPASWPASSELARELAASYVGSWAPSWGASSELARQLWRLSWPAGGRDGELARSARTSCPATAPDCLGSSSARGIRQAAQLQLALWGASATLRAGPSYLPVQLHVASQRNVYRANYSYAISEHSV